jgi:hypothetical protein
MIATSMRGTRLGALSLERDDLGPPAERVAVKYVCPNGHESVIPMSVEAEEIPVQWDCRCGNIAVRPNFVVEVKAPDRPVRTHWDMLLERRSLKELKALYEERVALLHEGALPRSA